MAKHDIIYNTRLLIKTKTSKAQNDWPIGSIRVFSISITVYVLFLGSIAQSQHRDASLDFRNRTLDFAVVISIKSYLLRLHGLIILEEKQAKDLKDRF